MSKFTTEQLENFKNSGDWYSRVLSAKEGYASDELKNDTEWKVRYAVARQGYALDELVNDPVERVREEALKHL